MDNAYATLAEYKAYAVARGQTASSDAADDAVIADLLEGASRYIDGECGGRKFYPSVETHYYSVPDNSADDRMLWFAEDVLEIISVTNGEGTAVSNDDYYLMPRNYEPKYAIHLKDSVSTYWQASSTGEVDYVIAIAAFCGYHNGYSQRAWGTGGTLNGAINDTITLAFTMAGGHGVLADQVIKIDNELLIVDSVSANTITALRRGDNGSTAATHADGATVHTWQPMRRVQEAALAITQRAYANRVGQSSQGSVTVTAAGVVIRPEDVPPRAQKVIESLRLTI